MQFKAIDAVRTVRTNQNVPLCDESQRGNRYNYILNVVTTLIM